MVEHLPGMYEVLALISILTIKQNKIKKHIASAIVYCYEHLRLLKITKSAALFLFLFLLHCGYSS